MKTGLGVEYKARTSKVESEAFEAKQKVCEVIEMNNNGRKDIIN